MAKYWSAPILTHWQQGILGVDVREEWLYTTQKEVRNIQLLGKIDGEYKKLKFTKFEKFLKVNSVMKVRQ